MTKKLKDELQVAQENASDFVRNETLGNINEHFKRLNWLPMNQRFKQCVSSAGSRYIQNNCPAYMNEVLGLAGNTRNSSIKLNRYF